MRRIAAHFLIGLTLGCSSQTSSPNDSKSSLRIAIGSHPSTLDPRYTRDAYGTRIVALTHQSLVKVGPDLKVVGDAAEYWEYSNKKYQFFLKSPLIFANGRQVTKEDLEFSFSEYLKPTNPFHSTLKTIDRVKVDKKQGKFVVSIFLKEFSAKLLNVDLSTIKILPKKETLEIETQSDPLWMGSGSFQLFEKKANSYILNARKDHPQISPKIHQVIFQVIQNNFTLYQKLLKGEIDIAQSEVPLSKINEFKEQPQKFNVYEYPGLSFSYLLINHKTPPLNQKVFRQALSQAIHRKEIIKYKLEGFASEATSYMPPTNPFHRSGLKNIKFDQNEALQKIKKWKGLKLVLKTSSSVQAVDNARVLAFQLKKAGLDVEIKSFEWGTFFTDVQRGHFQLATLRWVGVLDPDLYRIALHSQEAPPGRNRGSYSNSKLDVLLDQGLKIESLEKRIQHYYKVQKMVLDDLAVIPLWYDQQVNIVNRRVKNYHPSKTGDYSPLLYVSE